MNTLYKRKHLFRVLQLIIVIILVTSILNQTPEVSAVASQASLKPNVTVYLHNKQLMPSDEGQVALVTLLIDNQSSAEVDLIDYWARIKGKNNSYVTKISKQDEEKKTILPGNKEYISYYASVSNSELVYDISVDVIKWDFSKSNYEAVVGNLTIAEINQPNINEEASIHIGEVQLTTVLEDQFIYEDIDSKIISYRMKLTNELNRTADISTFSSFAVINKTEVYEANTVISETSVRGKSEVYLYGQVSVPKDMTIDAMSIALVDKHQDVLYPLLMFPVDTLVERTVESIEKDLELNIGGNIYILKGENVNISSEGNRAVVELPFKITNKSKNIGKLDEMIFYVKTKSGLIYHLKLDESNATSLLPEIEESIVVRGFVPDEQALIDSQLLIGLKVGEQEVIVKNISLGSLEITEPSESSLLTINGQEIQIDRLSRVPNAEFDLLVAEFVIKNTSKDSKKPLALGGQFIIDGVKIDIKETKIIRMNKNLTILPNETERVVAYINVPFTQVISDYKFDLTIDEKSVRTINMSLAEGSRLLAKNEKYTLKTIGKRAEVTFYNSSLYTGNKDDLFVVELLVKNIESRNVTPSSLNGYIETKDGEIYQLEFEEYPGSIMPKGSIIMVGSAKIPKNMSLTLSTIHFGEQLAEEGVIYTDPVYVLHESINIPKTNLIDMVNVGDKKFWVWNTTKEWIASNGTDIDGMEVMIDYQVDEVVNSIEQVGDKNIVVEYIDLLMPTIKMSDTLSISGEQGVIGRGMLKLSYMNPTVPYSVLTQFNINVYEQYKGYKKVVMSEQFDHVQ